MGLDARSAVLKRIPKAGILMSGEKSIPLYRWESKLLPSLVVNSNAPAAHAKV
jgi:hypothetical protein